MSKVRQLAQMIAEQALKPEQHMVDPVDLPLDEPYPPLGLTDEQVEEAYDLASRAKVILPSDSKYQYPDSPKTPVMTVAAVIEWLEGEKEDLESDRKKIKTKYPKQLAKKIDDQLGASITTIETLIEKLTKGTFEQMDEATGNE